MKLKNHRLEGADYTPAKWMGAKITPEIVVLHDTASRLDKGNAARYLQNNKAKVSAHFVIEIDGTITQLVPVNRRANHAGRSSYHGRKSCNGFSIGIEIVNPGKMTKRGPGAQTWYGTTLKIDELGIQEMSTPEHGHGYWLPYDSRQIDALMELLEALFDYVPTLTDIVTHWYISPGRKIDTNPLFPLDHVKSRILGRDDPQEEELEEATD